MMCLELPLPNAALTVGREWQPVATLTSAKTMFIRGVTADVKYLKPWDGLYHAIQKHVIGGLTLRNFHRSGLASFHKGAPESIQEYKYLHQFCN
jgi:hypothetical protein